MCVISVLSEQDEMIPFISWGARLAASLEMPLVLLCHLPAKEDQEPKEIKLEETQEHPLLEATRQEILRQKLEDCTLWSLRCVGFLPTIAKITAERKARLLILGQSGLREEEAHERSLETHLLKQVSCDVMLMRPIHAPEDTFNRILVPTAGGPHARAALRLVAGLAKKEEDLKWKSLYISSDEGLEAQAVGQQILEENLRKAGVDQAPRVERSVILGNDVSNGIIEEAQRGYDLLLVGASNMGVVRRTLFGNIQKRLLQEKETVDVAVLHAAPPLLAVARNRVVRWLSQIIPQMDRQARVDLFTHLQEGSRATFNFLALICLSTAIAALGLLQNSPAVVIGAMLVAPLMTPMLGAGLALVQGNLKLAKDSTNAILTGFLCSLAIGTLIGLIAIRLDITAEILARGAPNLLDLLIALLSGTAAAYALARPGLMAALPGVAIAAALVPPIASVGISLSHGQFSVAAGAAFLFFTNLTAIILASSLTFYLVGVRPDLRSDQPRRWARRLLLTLSTTAMLIAFPLGVPLLRTAPTAKNQLHASLQSYIQKKAPQLLLHRLSLLKEQGVSIAQIEISSPTPLSQPLAQEITTLTKKTLSAHVRVRILTSLLWHSELPPVRAIPTQPSSRPAAPASSPSPTSSPSATSSPSSRPR
ncbi:MAG: DUF389 domain-containing protein [Myxococcales bacterium]|nr:DUF389 domain-containing protein [Myxococcales bacterium]